MKLLIINIVFIFVIGIIVIHKDIKNILITFKFISNNYNPVDYKKRRILILTVENRNLEYINLHNEIMEKYAELNNYSYIHLESCNDHNITVYWCKIYKVLEYLKTGEYDYVFWSDSDTIVTDYSTDIDTYISKFGEKDIIIGIDGGYSLFDGIINILNSGLFLIKNSEKGIQFLEDCINDINNKDECIKDGKEQGFYSLGCYEQGIMNELIKNKYSEFVYVDYSKQLIDNISNKLPFMFSTDYKGLFVHLPGYPDDKKNEFFKKIKYSD